MTAAIPTGIVFIVLLIATCDPSSTSSQYVQDRILPGQSSSAALDFHWGLGMGLKGLVVYARTLLVPLIGDIWSLIVGT